MNEPAQLNRESPAVQKHLEINQNIIMHMAGNSRSCKVWCITLVSAVLVLVAQTGEANHALIALGPSALFYVLDSYYLALERGFRQSLQRFVQRLHEGSVSPHELFAVERAYIGSIPRETLSAMLKSFSVVPFYSVIVATVLLAWLLIF